MTPGTPQYLIQFMGTGSAESDLGLEANADYGNYGNPYPPDNVAYYRVTARSSAPASRWRPFHRRAADPPSSVPSDHGAGSRTS